MPRPGRGPRVQEKSKDFKGSMIRLIKNLKPWKYIMIFAMILALISAVLALITPDKLSSLTDTISQGIKPNTEKMTEISTSIIQNIDKENMNAYVVLQLLSEIKDPNELDEVAISVIKDYIFKYGVKKDKLFELAKVFPAQTSRKLLHSGVLYDSTHA